MASNSVQEIIGGVENGGGIPQDGDEDRSELAGGAGASGKNELWLQDLDLGNNIFGIVALSKVGLITLIWLAYYWNGSKLTSYYYWAWFSAVLAVNLSWGPVGLAYILLLSNGDAFAETLFFYTSQISIIGPMVGYFAPLVVLVLAYNEKKETGLQY